MAKGKIIIRFEGAAADRHELGMRQLGESLIGIERLITMGLFAMDSGRFPKRMERLPFVVRASEPRKGSVEFMPILDIGTAFLPIIHEIYLSKSSEFIWRWLSGALLKMGGREKDADVHLDKLFDLLDKVDARRHLEALGWQKLYAPARQVVSPVGPSCDRLVLQDAEFTEIDLPVAESIRSRGKLEVGDMETYRIKVDGFIHHNKQLKIEHPHEKGKFITGHVRDPAFQNAPNVYTEAATKQGWLKVTAKPTSREGRLEALYIMDGESAEGSE